MRIEGAEANPGFRSSGGHVKDNCIGIGFVQTIERRAATFDNEWHILACLFFLGCWQRKVVRKQGRRFGPGKTGF